MRGPLIGSLFSGYGGLDAGVQAVLGGCVAWHSEIDPAATRVLAHNTPGTLNLGDITTVDWASVPRVDVITGGFPCQDVSTAGSRRGLRPGTRSGLWAHMAYAIAQLRPALVVIENVRGLLTARGAPPTDELVEAWAVRDKTQRVLRLLDSKLAKARREGRTDHVHRHQRDRVRFLGRHRTAVAAAKRADARIVRALGVVLGDLADIGFDAEWCVCPASGVGAPHQRERVFILAWPAAPDPRGGELQRRRVGEVLAGAESAGEGEGAQRERDRDTTRDGGEDVADPDGVGPVRAGGARGRRTRPTDGDPPPPDTDRVGPQDGDGGQPRGPAPGHEVVDWGDYGPAIARWETVLGWSAPAPTMTGARGGQQLSPRFVEWMMGLWEGWVTDVPGLSRNAMIAMLGRGVVPAQVAAAVRWLLAARALRVTPTCARGARAHGCGASSVSSPSTPPLGTRGVGV